MSVSPWTPRVTALLVVLLVALVGGLALAQGAPPPGPPDPQGPPGAPATPGAPGQPGAVGEPGTPSLQQTIKGDTAAWAEVEAAQKKLNSLSGYRTTASQVGSHGNRSVFTSEMVPPNSSHTTLESTEYSVGAAAIPASVAEMVIVNGQTRFRIKIGDGPWGLWECPKAPPAPATGASIQRTVEASRGPDTTIEGTPVRTYVYTTTFPDKPQNSMKNTLYVDTQTGLPRREVIVVIVGPDNQSTFTMDFYDYSAKIDITLPPCEKET